MAHIFTTTFLYRRRSYTAVISQVVDSLSIYLPDNDLHGIVPEGKVSLSTLQGLKMDTPQNTPASDLILSVLKALKMQPQNEGQQTKDPFG